MNVRRSYDMDDVNAMREVLRDRLLDEAAISVRCARMAEANGWPLNPAPYTMRRAAWATVLALLLVAGCGGGPLRAHAVGVTLAHAALTSGADAVMDARAADLDACPDPACLDAGEARWQPWVASLRLVVEAWETWRDAVVTGFGLPDESVAAATAAVALRHLLALWAALADVVPGGVLPRGPAEVLVLIAQ